VAGVSSTLIFGLNFKNYQEISYNTNNFNSSFTYVNPGPQTNTINSPVHSPQPIRTSDVQYLPLNLGVNGSMPDRFGITFFNAQANVNLAVLNGYEKSFQPANGTNAAVTTLTHGGFSQVAYSAKSADHYVTVQAGATRDQTLYKEWSVRLHADGQWADTPLFSNEQYGMGGATGVRGYQSGVAYGDTGWRVTMEPRTPQVSIGMAGNEGDEVPVWLRGSVFMDYGQLYRLDSTTASSFNTASFWGVGWGLTANIGSHFDARISMAWPLLSNPEASGGSAYVYFAVGAQF
jgi:hemolysin activation/secretion protein